MVPDFLTRILCMQQGSSKNSIPNFRESGRLDPWYASKFLIIFVQYLFTVGLYSYVGTMLNYFWVIFNIKIQIYLVKIGSILNLILALLTLIL